jgi:hypothetical protein
MTARTLALAALGLWIVTIAALAFVFLRGFATPAPDGRLAVRLAPGEVDFIRGEMRGLLVAVQGVVEGLAAGDRARVVEAARSAGMAGVNPPLSLMPKLPADFRQMGASVHEGFDTLAGAAGAGEDDAAVLRHLGARLAICVGCHATYRFDPDVAP